jgi:predicted transglutaminase-like cysteine proteinase
MSWVNSRALFALALFVLLATFSAPAAAGAMQVAANSSAAREPFGSRLLLPSGGAMLAKWATVLRQWNDERQIAAACSHDPDQCSNPAALDFLSMVDAAKGLTGLAQLGEINRTVNLSIKPVDDQVAHGAVDVWSSPLATLGSRSGDCEDYAILKFVVLLEAGLSPADIRILIVRDVVRSEDHAIVAVRHEGQWLLLDNRRLVIRADFELVNYQPLMQMDVTGAQRYLDISTAAAGGQEAATAREVEPSTVSSLP